MNTVDALKEIAFFNGLEQGDLEALAGICNVINCEEDQIIFDEGDPGGSMYVVAEGTVLLTKTISQFVDKDLLTAKAGMVFGEISFIDMQSRSAKAAASAGTIVIEVAREAYDGLAAANPGLALVPQNLAATLADRLRLANDLLKESLIWGLEAAGGAALNLDKIISDSVTVKIDLTDGKSVEGKILKVEQSMAGYEITLKNDEEGLSLIPYHAITRVYV